MKFCLGGLYKQGCLQALCWCLPLGPSVGPAVRESSKFAFPVLEACVLSALGQPRPLAFQEGASAKGRDS